MKNLGGYVRFVGENPNGFLALPSSGIALNAMNVLISRVLEVIM